MYLPCISLTSPLYLPCISQVRVLKLHWDPATKTSDHFALGTPLQPYVHRPATACGPPCSPMWPTLQPHVAHAPDERPLRTRHHQDLPNPARSSYPYPYPYPYP